MKKNSLQMIALTLALSSVVFVSCDTMDDDFTHADSNNISSAWTRIPMVCQ